MSSFVTGEAVVLDLRPARVASRGLGFAVDATIQVSILVGLVAATAWLASQVDADAALVAVMSLVAVVAALVGYPVATETLTRGRTVGMLALGLRVVRDDGGPERFRHALVRALFGVVELWVTFGSVALIASLSSQTGKRLGDQFAGTVVVVERSPGRDAPSVLVPPWLTGWAASADLSRVPDALALSARQFLLRADQLSPAARIETGTRLAADVAARVSPPPPPGTPVEAVLAAVVGERGRREAWRYAYEQQAAAGGLTGAPTPTQARAQTPAPVAPAPVTPTDPRTTNGGAPPAGFAPPS